MASAKAKIRHVFGDTFSCRAAPPDILVKLSGKNPQNYIEFALHVLRPCYFSYITLPRNRWSLGSEKTF